MNTTDSGTAEQPQAAPVRAGLVGPRHAPAACPTADLEALATALGPEHFATVLITGRGRLPHLAVTSRRYAQLTESIYAQDGWFWWSWAERIAPASDIEGTAGKIALVLRVAPAPSRG
jgi:hypothetical protein